MKRQVVPIVPGNGNSKHSPSTEKKKQISPSKHWVFTLNNYTEAEIVEFLADSSIVPGIRYVFQEEIGEDTGTPHLQGYVCFSTKARPKSKFTSNRIWWEKCRKVKASIDYAQKVETRKPGGRIWKQGIKIIKAIKCLKSEDLYEYQKTIEKLIQEEPDERSIYWFWEPVGKVGKSVFCKYLVVKHHALILSGKGADMKYGVMKYVEKTGAYPEILILDIPRCCEGYISHSGIEEVKNGCFFSPKYESGMVIGNCPHIVCFANFYPAVSKMSADRWKIFDIIDGEAFENNEGEDFGDLDV